MKRVLKMDNHDGQCEWTVHLKVVQMQSISYIYFTIINLKNKTKHPKHNTVESQLHEGRNLSVVHDWTTNVWHIIGVQCSVSSNLFSLVYEFYYYSDWVKSLLFLEAGQEDPVYSTFTFSTTGGWHFNSVSAWFWVEGMGWGRRNILWEWCSIGIRLGSAPQTSRPWDEARVSLQQGTGNCR